tara:strand:- start:223 stop:480 length:258 start_codon:yes stop_codon:yes gene_type:complete
MNNWLKAALCTVITALEASRVDASAVNAEGFMVTILDTHSSVFTTVNSTDFNLNGSSGIWAWGGQAGMVMHEGQAYGSLANLWSQ